MNKDNSDSMTYPENQIKLNQNANGSAVKTIICYNNNNNEVGCSFSVVPVARQSVHFFSLIIMIRFIRYLSSKSAVY